MRQLNDLCALCGATKNIIHHHISYKPEKIMFVCRSCHLKIHTTDKYLDLRPSVRQKPIIQNLNLTNEMLQGIDRAIELGYTTNRSEFIRSLIGEKLKDLSIITEMKSKKQK